MIVKMNKVTIVIAKSHIDDSLAKLREFGLLHIKHINLPSGPVVSRLQKDLEDADRILSLLETKVPKAQYSDVSFEALSIMIKDALHIFDARRKLIMQRDNLRQKLQWFKKWGKVSYKQLKSINESGVFIRLYIINKAELKAIPEDKLIFVIKRGKGKFYIALISKKESERLYFEETAFPEEDFDSASKEMTMVEGWISDINDNIEELAKYKNSFDKYKAYVARQFEFYKVRSGMAKEEGFWYLQGFIPQDNTNRLKQLVGKEEWGMLAEEPDDPAEVPTLIKNPRWVSIIEPVFKFIGTVPGYAEYDLSVWFLIFLTLFFAILIGDAGYGTLFLVGTFIARNKLKNLPGESFSLMYVFSIATIIWGLITGTWFGVEKIGQLPCFKFFVIERINSFVNTNQIFMMYLCFIIGAIHLTIAHSMIILRLRKSLTAFAQGGWILIIWGLFFLAGTLVLGKVFPQFALWLLIAGTILVVLFSYPQKNMVKAAAVSLGDIPLKLISSFSDIVSYFRLFAVGYATVIVAVSFNNMAMSVGFSNFLKGLGFALILFLGHSLNIILGFMAIIVHGIRLNMLEFSGHLGMEWSGKLYAPFRE